MRSMTDASARETSPWGMTIFVCLIILTVLFLGFWSWGCCSARSRPRARYRWVSSGPGRCPLPWKLCGGAVQPRRADLFHQHPADHDPGDRGVHCPGKRSLATSFPSCRSKAAMHSSWSSSPMFFPPQVISIPLFKLFMRRTAGHAVAHDLRPYRPWHSDLHVADAEFFCRRSKRLA